MNVRIQKGTKSHILRILLWRNQGPGRSPMTGLRHDASDHRACFLRERDSKPTDITLVETNGEYVAGGFREIDAESMPGLYELHLPDECLTGTGHGTVVMLQSPGAEPCVIQIDLVGYDPYDGERLGLTCLSQESRHACLTSAFQTVVPEIVEDLKSEK